MIDLDDIRRAMTKRSTEDLREVIGPLRETYRPEAVQFAIEELERRGASLDEEIGGEAETTDRDSPPETSENQGSLAHWFSRFLPGLRVGGRASEERGPGGNPESVGGWGGIPVEVRADDLVGVHGWLRFISTTMVALPVGQILFFFLMAGYGALRGRPDFSILIIVLLSALPSILIIISGLALQAEKPWAVRFTIWVLAVYIVVSLVELVIDVSNLATILESGFRVAIFTALIAYFRTSRRVKNTFPAWQAHTERTA